MHNLETDTTYKLEPGNPAVIALEALAAEDNLAGTGARNLLIASGLLQYDEPVILPEPQTKSVKVEHPVPDNPDTGSALRIFPNPANDYITIEYELQENGSLVTNSIDGKILFSIQLLKGKDQRIVPVQDLVPGNYMVSLFAGSKTVATVILTIH